MNLQTVIIEREFAHPLEVIFRAFVDPEISTKWIAPDGFQCIENVNEARVGGISRTVLQDREGNTSVCEGNIIEFIENQEFEIEFWLQFGDFKIEGLKNKTTFKQSDLGTKVIVELLVPEGDFVTGATAGWNQSFDNLEKQLEQSS
ncbi:MAG: SRPBCC domain-containing protein [Armatimonadetes bacterium]|nr:SRPBCC domain-containing protein [Armatimonadota bacterium]